MTISHIRFKKIRFWPNRTCLEVTKTNTSVNEPVTIKRNALRYEKKKKKKKKKTKITKLLSYQWHDNFFADWIYRRICNLLAGKKRHFVIRELHCSWSSVFWKDRRDWAPTLTSGHFRFNCTETSLGWLLNILRGWGMVTSGPALSGGRLWQKRSISMILRKNTGLWTVMTIPYKRNIREHLLPAPSFVGSSNHLCTLFSSIYPNLVFIIVSLNFQTSRSSDSKLRNMFFFKKSTLLNMRRHQYETLPKVLWALTVDTGNTCITLFVIAVASYLCKQLFEIVEHKLRMHSKTGQWCIIPHGAKSFLPK